jgi:hypothetical protein
LAGSARRGSTASPLHFYSLHSCQPAMAPD